MDDLTGQTFEHWTVLSRASRRSSSGAAYWNCQCRCGTLKVVFHSSLLKRTSKSCGCLGHPNQRKPHRKTPEYRIWLKMKARCYVPSNPGYAYYGSRGIGIDERWLTFDNFYLDMGPRPSPKHSIERRDNNGPYTPDNCVWATVEQQANNRRNTHHITFDGQTLTISEWAKQLGLSRKLIYIRLRNGWTPQQAFTLPLHARKRYAII